MTNKTTYANGDNGLDRLLLFYRVHIYHETPPNLKRCALDEPSFEPLVALYQPHKSTSTPPHQWTWKSFLRILITGKWILFSWDSYRLMQNVQLPLYCGRSNISSQAAISKCGCRGSTMIGSICFLLSVENRKFHAIPENAQKSVSLSPKMVHYWIKTFLQK